jgi:signal transduction histidine kinase/ActR/RegA family two-component response regulator
LVTPEYRANLVAATRGLIDSPEGRETELQIRRPDGQLRFVHSAATLVKGAQGELRLVGVNWDDTEALRAAEQAHSDAAALARTNAELVRTARVRDEFLAAMSHELRTPLNAVLGLAEMLLEGIHGELNAEQAHSVQTIEESGRHLLELISDILEASNIEAGAVKLHPSWVDLELLADAVKRRYAPAMVRKKLRLSFALAPGLKPLWADERRVQQMLGNLLNNAIKFTPEGGEVLVRLEPSLDGTDLQMVVEDSGIGIAEADLQRLFEPFVQLDAGLDRRYGGTGLGLSLVRTLAELHGGEVHVTSTPGRGSLFCVALPLRPAHRPDSGLHMAQAVPPGVGAAGLASRRDTGQKPLVMVAEDNETNFELLKAYLNSRGFRVVHAADGVEAVAKGRSLRPDLVLMDIQMPGMDGLQATRLLRAETDAKVARVPIIAVTAMALPGDRDRCLEAGVDGYLAKPMSLHALAAMMDNLLAASNA